MARSNFGGTDSAAWVMGAPSTHGSFAVSSPNLTGGTAWDSATGGTQYTDLILVGGGATTVRTDVDGFVKAMQGPDGVNEGMWIDLGGGSRFWLRTTDSLDSIYARVIGVTGLGAVGDFDAVAMTGTDSTAAFQSAIDAIAALASTSRPVLYVEAGTYKISSPLTGIPSNLRIVGQGKRSTRLCYTGTGVMFDLGTYTTTPANPWVGTVSGFQVEGMQIDVPGTSYASEGTRVPTCIRDNGNGSAILRNTLISGFAYGFNGAYGSDFTAFENVDFLYNDVGAYFGPGSEQVSITGSGQFLGNREGLVLDRAPQGYVRTQFIDSSVGDVVVEYNAASVRSGVVATLGLAYNMAAWNLDDCWFESDADGSGTRIPAQHIWTKGDSAGYPQYLSVRRPYLASGGAASTSNAFWRNSQGTRHVLEDLVVYGSQIKYAVAAGSTAPQFVQRNTRQTDGWTGLVLWDTETANTLTMDDYLSRQTGPTGAVLRSWRKTGDAFDRVQVTANGALLVGDGTIAPPATIQALNAATTGMSASLWRFTCPNVASPALEVYGAGAMTASHQRWRTSGGTVISEIDANGNLHGGIWTKAGTPVDGDFANPRDGLCAIDTTASKFWIRVGGVWKSATFA